MSDIMWLAESENFKIYSISENVYFKDKRTCHFHDKFEESDYFIHWVYGDPTGAIILASEKHVVIVGSGIIVFNTINRKVGDLFSDPNDLMWIAAVYQDEDDDHLDEFRFVGFNELNNTRVFKYNIQTEYLCEVE